MTVGVPEAVAKLQALVRIPTVSDREPARVDTRAFDRLLASRLAAHAVECLASGKHGVLVGLLKGEIATTPLDVVTASKKPLDLKLFELASVLSR